MAINFSNRRQVERLKNLGNGGEADIYEYNATTVIKLFKPKVDLRRKEQKVRYFISIKAKLPANVIGPEEEVTINGRFAGYTMKKLVGTEDLHMLIKPKFLAAQQFSNKDVLQIITKFGKDIEVLHANGIIIGDISDFNFQIIGKKNYFIDVDSWGKKGKFPPDAYTEMFTCPDSYAPDGNIEFSGENENYNFAVLAFNMLARIHPFGGTYIPNKELSPLERMRKKISVVGKYQKDIKIPKNIGSWKWMSPKLEEDFIQIFEKEKRFDITPDLQELLDNMKYCSTHDVYYYSKFSECPICNENAKVKEAPIIAKVTQTANGPQVTMIFKSTDCAYILSNVHYLNRNGEAVHMETGRKFAIPKGKRVDFSSDGKNMYVADQDIIEIYDEKNQRTAVVQRMHKSAYIIKDRDLYYIDKGGNLIKLIVTDYGNMPTCLEHTYNPLFTVAKDGRVFVASMYPEKAIITTPDYTFELSYSGRIKEYAIKYDQVTNKWLFVYELPNGKYRTIVFSKNKIEYDDDIILYNAQTLSNIDFYNNTIYDPADSRIIGINLIKNTAKEFPCSVVDESSKLKFDGHGFKIYGKNNIYHYG